MTNKRRIPLPHAALAACLATLVAGGPAALAAEAAYPFEGTWVRANRACTPSAPLARTYTAREVTSANSHCTVRKIAAGSGQFELFEECRRAERPGSFTETIRMLGPDAMVVRRQAARLKIPRPLRYIRCSVAAPGAQKPLPAPQHHPTPPAGGEEHSAAPKATGAAPGAPPTVPQP